MKKFNKNLIVSVIAVLAVSCALGLVGPATTQAATTPPLGLAATYGILADTYVDPATPLPSTVNGDVGFTTGPAQDPLPWPRVLPYLNYGALPPYPVAHTTDAAKALTALSAGLNAACDFTFPAGAVNLSTEPTHIPVWGSALGEYVPGIYCTAAPGAATIGAGGITLNGNGTYIFRIQGALTTVADSKVRLAGGASACNVFWAPIAATTIGAYTGVLPDPSGDAGFVGTVIDNNNAINVGADTTWIGRAWSLLLGVVTLGNNATITVPTCAVPPPPGGGAGPYTGTINVVKIVVGGTKTVADFPLFINDNSIISGVTNNFSFYSTGAYYVTETSNPNYTSTFSGDCDATGLLYLTPGQNKFCVLTNNYTAPVVVAPVPPLIDVVKVPNPLALPAGPGAVTYTYTLRNIGTVPVTNITMVGDTCSPIVLASGDTNADAKLDLSETWIYHCSTTLSATHTNTVVATGWANGISATDIATATVVVGTPLVPPLIHVTKVPSPLALRAGGGMVTYTEKITNPGTVALSNVKLTDDKCSPMKYISGDTNGDSKLDTTETWTYTCRTNLTKTTTNTAIASGEANGYTVRDIAIATVVVATAVPKLPNTGFAPSESSPWNIVIPIVILAVSISLYFFARKKQLS